MTLTAVQAEIVRRFVAGEITLKLVHSDPRFSVEAALRAALIQKDEEIAKLRARIHGNGENDHIGGEA